MCLPMTEAVQISLITAASGLFGALLGAIAAVVGPWWLKKYEIESERERAYIELRRVAIIEYANSKLAAMQEYQKAFRLGVGVSENTIEALNDANRKTTALFSLIRKEDANLKNWINKMQFKYLNMPVKTPHELAVADAFLGLGIQHLLSWHVGELRTADMKPFGLNSKSESVWLENWDAQWPK